MLPPGLPPGTKAVYDGKYFYLTGIASKSGVYTPIVTFTRGSGATKKSLKFSFTITVYEQNPALIGTFNGVTSYDSAGTDIRPYSELVTITSAKGGKVTAKVGKMSLSGNGWRYDKAKEVYVAELFASTKEHGHNMQYTLHLEASPLLQEPGAKNFTGYIDRLDANTAEVKRYWYFFAKQNCYGKGYWLDDRAAELAAMKTMYFDNIELSDSWKTLPITTDTKAPIKVTVDKKGVLKLSGKINGISISGSTILLPETDGSLTGYLPCEKQTSPECSKNYLFRFTYKNGVPSLELKCAGGCG